LLEDFSYSVDPRFSRRKIMGLHRAILKDEGEIGIKVIL
jgi:hypothetical protein